MESLKVAAEKFVMGKPENQEMPMQEDTTDNSITTTKPPPAGTAHGLRIAGARVDQRAWRPAGTVVAVALAPAAYVARDQRQARPLSVATEARRRQQLAEGDRTTSAGKCAAALRVEKLKSDPDAIEREAREKLHYAKQGEVIVDLSGEAKPAAK